LYHNDINQNGNGAMERILVIGGTGRIARPVVREMVKAGYSVRVMTRDPQRSRALLPSTVEWCQGDLQDQGALATAMQQIDVIYINLPEAVNPQAAFVPDIHGIQNILETAPSGALLIKLSELGAAEIPTYKNLTLKFRADQQIQSSGHPYIIFRPSWFMESLPLILTQGKRLLYAGAQPFPLHWIAGQDFAKQVIAALQNRSHTENRIFPVQGPEAMPFAEAIDRYTKATGDNLSRMRIPLWALRLAGVFNAEIQGIYELMAHFDRHREIFESKVTWEQLGKPTITIEKFVENWKASPEH
jgi:uncharacterized protein YbjT (DUF2867 family)